MRMIAASENERSPFLLEEPRWTNDDQVFVINYSFICVPRFFNLFVLASFFLGSELFQLHCVKMILVFL